MPESVLEQFAEEVAAAHLYQPELAEFLGLQSWTSWRPRRRTMSGISWVAKTKCAHSTTDSMFNASSDNFVRLSEFRELDELE